MKIKVYAVWTLEDSDWVKIFLNEEEADALYKEYGEFGRWEEKEFNINKMGEELT